MNIREMARLCQVSRQTVANVFAAPEKVRAETRERVLAIARQYVWRPNRAAAASFNRKTRVVGVLNYGIELRFFRDIELGIQEVLTSRGYLPIILRTDWKNRLAQIQRLVDQRVDGILMVNVRRELRPEELLEFSTQGIPRVIFDFAGEDGENFVGTDDFSGGAMAATRLLKLGHRNFLLFGTHSPFDLQRDSLRFRGFRETVGIAGARCEYCDGPVELRKHLSAPVRPTAVFLYNDTQAPEVYSAAAEMNLAVPADLSVVGFADVEPGEWLLPPLDTVRQNGLEVGRIATRFILERIETPDGPPLGCLVPCEWVPRGSSAPAM